MSGGGDQVSASFDAITHTPALAPGTDTMKLYAQALADRFRPEGLVLHVVDVGSTVTDPNSSLPVKIFRVFEETTPPTQLDETASDPNLLVIDTRGPGNLSRIVLALTAQEHVFQSHVPVVTIGPGVPRPEEPIRFQSIVCVTDYSPEAAKACVFALSFAQDFGAQVYLCHVLPDPSGGDGLDEDDLDIRFLNAVRALTPDIQAELADPDCVLDYKFAAEGVLEVAQRVKAGLVILGTRKTSRGRSEPTAGLALQIISGSTCPVLRIQG